MLGLNLEKKPKQIPHWENRHIALCAELEALTAQIKALTAKRNLKYAEIAALFKFEDRA